MPGFEHATAALPLARIEIGLARTCWIDLVPLLGTWGELSIKYTGKISQGMGRLVIKNKDEGVSQDVSLASLRNDKRDLIVPVRTGVYSMYWKPQTVRGLIDLSSGKEFVVEEGAGAEFEFGEPDGYGYLECGLAREGGEVLEGGAFALSDGNARNSSDAVTWMRTASFLGEKLIYGPLLPGKLYVVPQLPERRLKDGRYFTIVEGQTAEDWFVID